MEQGNTQGVKNKVERPHVKMENEVFVGRYNKLKAFGIDLFKDAGVVKSGIVADTDVSLAWEYMAEGAKIAEPEVWASYWNHIIIAPELGKRIAEEANYAGIQIDSKEIKFLLWLHDNGRLITPGAYFRNDLIGDRLMTEFGIPKTVIKSLPSISNLMIKGEELELTRAQAEFKEPLSEDQKVQAQNYFDTLTPAQRIINLADNLGKRTANGLFDISSFLEYLRTQIGRYDRDSDFASIHWAVIVDKNDPNAISRLQAGGVLQAYTIEKTVEWLQKAGINVDEILKGLQDYGPKFVVVARHGDLDNPTNIVYNRDSVMKTPIHLSGHGVKQMTELGKLMSSKQFKPKIIYVSPETRAQESTRELNSQLEVRDIEIVDDLDDGYLPGPYFEKMTMEELAEIGGNVYDEKRWKKYDHEPASSIAIRLHRTFDRLTSELKVGEVGTIVSHGDPIAWLVQTFDTNKLPEPSELRKGLYPGKGEAVVAVIGPDDKVFTYYLLNEDSVRKQEKITY